MDYLEGYHSQVNICLQNEVGVILSSCVAISCVCCGAESVCVCVCVQSSQYKTVERLVQTLKNLCCALDEVETQNITEAVKRLRHSVNLPRTHSPKVGF